MMAKGIVLFFLGTASVACGPLWNQPNPFRRGESQRHEETSSTVYSEPSVPFDNSYNSTSQDQMILPSAQRVAIGRFVVAADIDKDAKPSSGEAVPVKNIYFGESVNLECISPVAQGNFGQLRVNIAQVPVPGSNSIVQSSENVIKLPCAGTLQLTVIGKGRESIYLTLTQELASGKLLRFQQALSFGDENVGISQTGVVPLQFEWIEVKDAKENVNVAQQSN